MKLEFNLLIIDDEPDSINGSVGRLSDYLEGVGFSLLRKVADDLSEAGLRRLARDSGRNFDLVMVDFNLGNPDFNGANAAKRLRNELRFTDILFYSSDRSAELFKQLSDNEVSGVFISNRAGDISDDLVGITETIIGKAIDINHMRGIAMAEVADMDSQMENVLVHLFSSKIPIFDEKAKETLTKLIENEESRVNKLRETIADGKIMDVLTDSAKFSSADRSKAISRVCRVLGDQKPKQEIEKFKNFISEILGGRNILAHVKAETDADGNATLRSQKQGQESIIIDDAWMRSFRSLLREHKAALTTICAALTHFADETGAEKGAKA